MKVDLHKVSEEDFNKLLEAETSPLARELYKLARETQTTLIVSEMVPPGEIVFLYPRRKSK